MTASLMSSPRVVRRGAQQPRVCSVPRYVRTLGPEAVDFMTMVGRPPLPWQRDVLRDAMGVRADGKWAAYEVAIWLARQNGKGYVTEAQELFGAYMLREQKIVHSAHLFDTSREAFNRLCFIIENSDWLRKRTLKPLRGKGNEAIPLTRAAGGGVIEFKARTLHGARGLTGERVTLDEAYALTVGHYQAMSPIMATLPNPQITYTSSPPDDKTSMMPEDALAPSIRLRGLSGTDPSLASFEWSPPEKYDLTDVDVWYNCNPSLGDEAAIAAGMALIDEEFLHRQWRVFESSDRPQAFATEHLGLWPESGAEQWKVIPKADWSKAAATFDHPSPVAFSVVLSTDRSWATICGAGPIGDDLIGVVVVDRREGTGWVIERLKQLIERWRPVAVVIDKGSPAKSLADDAEAAGIELTPITTRDVAGAAGALYDGIAGRPARDPETGEWGHDPRVVRHREQDELTTAVAGALPRKLASGWAFDQMAATVDISPVIGCSNALWAYTTHTPPPFFAGKWGA